MPITIRSAYTKRQPSKTNIKDFGESLAVQEQKESTDINNILKRFDKTGLIDHVNQNEAQYGEFAQYDLHHHMNTVAKIQSTFNELPATVKKQFNNSPQEWIEHLANPQNVEDMKDGVIDNPVELQDGDAVVPSAGTAETGATSEPS